MRADVEVECGVFCGQPLVSIVRVCLIVRSCDTNRLGDTFNVMSSHLIYLVCTRRECQANESIIEEHKALFESRISLGETEKLPGGENLTQKQLRDPMMWKDMPKSVC